MEKIARKKRTACRAEKTASLNKLPRETESFAQAFSKACRVQRRRLWRVKGRALVGSNGKALSRRLWRRNTFILNIIHPSQTIQ